MSQEGMHRRQTTMFDGRYLYYYTFDDEPPTPHADDDRRDASASPEATEEKDV
jgi:hypothetical protein